VDLLFTIDGEAVVTGADGVAVFDALHRRHRDGENRHQSRREGKAPFIAVATRLAKSLVVVGRVDPTYFFEGQLHGPKKVAPPEPGDFCNNIGQEREPRYHGFEHQEDVCAQPQLSALQRPRSDNVAVLTPKRDTADCGP
jgi:hypothetical protein